MQLQDEPKVIIPVRSIAFTSLDHSCKSKDIAGSVGHYLFPYLQRKYCDTIFYM